MHQIKQLADPGVPLSASPPKSAPPPPITQGINCGAGPSTSNGAVSSLSMPYQIYFFTIIFISDSVLVRNVRSSWLNEQTHSYLNLSLVVHSSSFHHSCQL